jgi:hypothetical protein
MLPGCSHSPPCGSASAHHARLHYDGAARIRANGTLAPTKPLVKDGFAPAPRDEASPAAKRAARRRAFDRAPWEMTAEEFDAVAEPFVEMRPTAPGRSWPGHRMFGLTVSTMRFGMRLRLVVEGGPDGGYLADVDWSDEASLEDPRRAFIADALAQGYMVPRHVLADYPELQPEA